MKTDHTPEPWRIGTPPPNGEQTIGNEKGLMVAVATTGHGVSAEANARRIVACVNACAGIPTDDLEMSPRHGLLHLADFANELMKQGENERLRIALDCTKTDLVRMRCPDFFEGVKGGYETLFDGHLVNMIGLINDYAKQK